MITFRACKVRDLPEAIHKIDFSLYTLWEANKMLRDGAFSAAEVHKIATFYNANVWQLIDGRDGCYKSQLAVK